MHFKDKVIVITGASAGVGRATTRAFAKQHAKLAVIARGHTGLDAAKKEVEEAGGQAITFSLDVSDAKGVEDAATQIENHFGPIDIWVNNAMVSEYAAVWHMTPDEFKHIVDVTLLGQVYGTMAALKRMMPRDRGTIVHIGSALAHRSIPLQSAYCASKHGLYGFVESLRTELLHKKSNVIVTFVSLPGVNTPQFEWTQNKTGEEVRPVGKIYQPEVIADGILFAAQHARKELLIGWPTVESVAGERVNAALLDRYIAKAAWDGALEGPEKPNHPDNFWKPVERDMGAHGRFDSEAKSFSTQLWLNKNRNAVMLGLGAAALAGVALMRRNK
ncbi:MAG: SDR family oxidoreductase [Phycisphaerae bacterium]